eukprot:scaffold7962_cov139-Skeletonema_menzelii.AAC.1
MAAGVMSLRRGGGLFLFASQCDGLHARSLLDGLIAQHRRIGINYRHVTPSGGGCFYSLRSVMGSMSGGSLMG